MREKSESVKIRTGVSSRFLAVSQLVIGVICLLGGGFAWTNANFASKDALVTEVQTRIEDKKEVNDKLDMILKVLLRRHNR